MDSLQNINDLIARGELAEALAELDSLIDNSATDDDDRLLFARGKLHWRMGHVRQAITDYNAAVIANPDSPARLALEQARTILNFYDHDRYNP